jgi:hypothetical protein
VIKATTATAVIPWDEFTGHKLEGNIDSRTLFNIA